MELSIRIGPQLSQNWPSSETPALGPLRSRWSMESSVIASGMASSGWSVCRVSAMAGAATFRSRRRTSRQVSSDVAFYRTTAPDESQSSSTKICLAPLRMQIFTHTQHRYLCPPDCQVMRSLCPLVPELDLEATSSDRSYWMAAPHSGHTVGKYKLGKKLGEGAFGLVFVAHDTGLDRDVALKFLRPHHILNPQAFERFLQEARSVAKLSHPGIVTVHELGTADGDIAFIAMELLQGESLNDRLNRVRRFSPDMAKEICLQIASTLDVAHMAGIVHRDLKPDNLFLIADPTIPGRERIKVLDFGIAKLAHTQMTSVQTGSLLIGTPRYMSPEQCRSSANVDCRSDIYALGCILYELVCGRPPFEGTPGELITKHQLASVLPAPFKPTPTIAKGVAFAFSF